MSATRAPSSLLLLHNISKKKNFGEARARDRDAARRAPTNGPCARAQIIRTAAAMGVSEVVVVGANKLSTHGAHGTAAHMRFSHFHRFQVGFFCPLRAVYDRAPHLSSPCLRRMR